MNTVLYLFRHAEAMGNQRHTFQGSSDCDISDRGKQQLEYLAEYCKALPLQALYSSPLLRARKTAEAVNRYHGLPIILRNDLREIDCGDWEGKSWSELEEDPEYRIWCGHLPDFCAPNGDSMREVYDRIVHEINGIVEEQKGKTIGIVSHGCALKNYLCYASGIGFERLMEIPWLQNTGICRVDYEDGFGPKVVFIDRAEHLPVTERTTLNLRWTVPKEK